jgi:hypothetical protein
MKPKKRALPRLLGAAALGASALAVGGTAATTLFTQSAGAVGCTSVPSIGLTAAMVVSTSQTVATQSVDATGCDIGIYVAPTASGTTIGGNTTADTVTVSGANDTGIFVDQASNVTVQNDTVQNNGVAPGTGIASFGGILIAGGSTDLVDSNTVTGNGGGGVFVNDNGPVNPGAPNAGPNAPVAATNDTVSNNTISGNYGSCGIVYATHNSGGSITGGSITGNTITGHIGVFRSTGPDLGGIVVAAASAGATVSNTTVSGNNISGSFEGGIIVHAHAPNDVVTGTSITGNTVGPANNWGSTNGPPTTAGIILGVDQLPPAIAPTITETTVGGNTIFGQFYGLWISGVTDVTINPANTITVLPGGAPTFNTPAPGSGYWQVAADGGVFNYGNASFFGSAGGIKLNKPVVGIAQTQDQGGYWLVASDGGVFSYGDASFHGSAGSLKLNQPVVGMAATPYVPGAGGAPASPAGLGYWLVAADGGIFNYGDAGFFGSAGGVKLNKPIVGMAPTPDGKGYWLVASDGGIFNYGDAGFFGSASTLKLTQPVVGIAATPDGKGYWVVSADGGVYPFGSAVQYGSAAGLKLNKPVVGITATPDGKGYWLTAADGGIFNYGDAQFLGSAGGIKLNQPVVGVTAIGTTFSG